MTKLQLFATPQTSVRASTFTMKNNFKSNYSPLLCVAFSHGAAVISGSLIRVMKPPFAALKTKKKKTMSNTHTRISAHTSARGEIYGVDSGCDVQ